MAKLSITTAWNESADYLKQHFGALFTLAVALITLPNVALQALGPAAAAPGETPEPGLWMLLLPVVLVLGIAGSLAISTLALGRAATIGEAIGHGFRRVLPMLGATLILFVLIGILLVPLVMATGLKPGDLAQPTPATAGKVLLLLVFLLALFLFLGTRLLLTTPVAAAERVGPLAIIARSWALTRGHFARLFGFLLLLGIAALVVLLVATMAVGLIVTGLFGPPAPGTTSGLLMLLVGGLLNAVFVVVMTTIVARLYLQLAGGAEPTSGS
ncbi:MAG TPA: hypothetical protein VEA60_05910 [Allosphingosinicella sp.]|nr:hypothetical protein [Allosphingosinicella sp.]